MTEESKSTKDKIKEMFLSGAVLTSCGTAEQFITADLRKYVSMLRRENMNIASEWTTSKNGKSFKKYWIKTPGKQLELEIK